MARKYKRLRYEDRCKIEQMCQMGESILHIAQNIGVHRDTIYKELSRTGTTTETYSADAAQKIV